MTQKEMSLFVDGLMAQTVARTKSATTTAVMGYDRAVTTMKAESVGLDKFKYVGQDDSKNRKFCEKRVGNIYSNSDADKWNNGQKEPASIYLGGYNCRHRKVYIVD